jgi:hypothetical protein
MRTTLQSVHSQIGDCNISKSVKYTATQKKKKKKKKPSPKKILVTTKSLRPNKFLVQIISSAPTCGFRDTFIFRLTFTHILVRKVNIYYVCLPLANPVTFKTPHIFS